MLECFVFGVVAAQQSRADPPRTSDPSSPGGPDQPDQGPALLASPPVTHRVPVVRGRSGPVQAGPTDVRGWALLLKQLRAQLNDPSSDVARKPWEHPRLYDALGQALTALDAVTPGGLAWLERND